VNCPSGSSFVTIVVKDSGGANVADGTAVTISTNLGSVSPTTATTVQGGVLVLYTSPSNQGGTATVTATAGGVTGTTNITVTCTPPATQAPPPTTGGGIVPPSTGDAGLVNNGSSSAGYVSIVLAAGLLFGALAYARVRA
jgi:adhesin/invasin